MLGISSRQLERWVLAGAPVAARGSRGRGHAMRVDVAAIAAWRATRGAAGDDARLLELAADVPAIVAEAIALAHVRIEGPHKRACAGALVAVWYAATTRILDRMRAFEPGAPDVTPDLIPEEIVRLTSVFRQGG